MRGPPVYCFCLFVVFKQTQTERQAHNVATCMYLQGHWNVGCKSKNEIGRVFCPYLKRSLTYVVLPWRTGGRQEEVVSENAIRPCYM